MKYLQLLKPYLIERWHYIAAGLFSLLIVDMLQLFIPRIIKWAVDDIALFSISFKGLFKYALFIVLSALFIGIFRFCWRYFIMGTARRIEEGIRELFFNHILTLGATFFDQRTAGDIMAHATNDMANIRMALGMGIVGMTDTIVLGCAAVFFMAYINVKLTILALLPMPFIAVFTKILSKKLFRAYRSVQESFSNLMESTRERFAGIRIIKAFNREDIESENMRRESEFYIEKSMKLVKLRGLIFPMVIFLTSISLAVIVGAGGRMVITNSITPGDFVAFISYLGLLTWPVMAIGWVTNMIQRGKASLDRVISILDTPGESLVPENLVKKMPDQLIPDAGSFFAPVHGDIAAENIFFKYKTEDLEGIGNGSLSPNKTLNRTGYRELEDMPRENGSTYVLNAVSFKIKKGEMLGIAGPPGSGKTTLAGLIPRIYDLCEGTITTGGINIKDMDINSLRKSISFMPQEPFLFSGTILENILFGDPDADGKKIESVMEMAGLTKTIESFSRGLNTVIGEKGVMLSGGQKQRVALARAFLKSAPIMILDDPVSQVDMETASKIIKNIESFCGEKTMMIISHRFSIFKKAHGIIVLDQGRIVQEGNHKKLIEQKGYYQRAWQMQKNEFLKADHKNGGTDAF